MSEPRISEANVVLYFGSGVCMAPANGTNTDVNICMFISQFEGIGIGTE